MASRKKGGNSNTSFSAIPVELQSIADLIENKLDEKFTEFQKTLEKYATKEKVDKLQANIRTNYYHVDKLEQYTRRENMRIHGWKFDPKADLAVQVVELLNHAVDIKDKSDQNKSPPMAKFSVEDISVCHPLKPKAGSGKQQVIVRFVSRSKLYQVFRVKKFLKTSPTYKDVFITDDMTPLRMKLLGVVKENPGTSEVFTREGNIHCSYKNKHFVITSPDDLFNIDMEVDFERLGLTQLK